MKRTGAERQAPERHPRSDSFVRVREWRAGMLSPARAWGFAFGLLFVALLVAAFLAALFNAIVAATS